MRILSIGFPKLGYFHLLTDRIRPANDKEKACKNPEQSANWKKTTWTFQLEI